MSKSKIADIILNSSQINQMSSQKQNFAGQSITGAGIQSVAPQSGPSAPRTSNATLIQNSIMKNQNSNALQSSQGILREQISQFQQVNGSQSNLNENEAASLKALQLHLNRSKSTTQNGFQTPPFTTLNKHNS